MAMKTWLKVVLVLAGVAALLAFVFIDGEQERARMTAKSRAVVTAVELERDVESRSLDETRYALQLATSEGPVATTATLPGDRTAEFGVGHSFTVCYNPADAREIDIQLDPDAQCGA